MRIRSCASRRARRGWAEQASLARFRYQLVVWARLMIAIAGSTAKAQVVGLAALADAGSGNSAITTADMTTSAERAKRAAGSGGGVRSRAPERVAGSGERESARRVAAFAQLRAELDARDAFLSRVASGLSASVSELERVASAAPKLPADVKRGLLELQAMARELLIIVSPDEPVQVRLRKRELCGWLASFCEEQRALTAQRGLTLSFEHVGAITCSLDEDLLATMLLELLSNAMKYRRKKPVTLHAAHSGKAVLITVTNHGCWVGPKPTYKRFQRGESRRNVQGYGIGLWLTRRLAQAHGGRFRVSGDRTRTLAVITIPAATRDEQAWFRATISHGQQS